MAWGALCLKLALRRSRHTCAAYINKGDLYGAPRRTGTSWSLHPHPRRTGTSWLGVNRTSRVWRGVTQNGFLSEAQRPNYYGASARWAARRTLLWTSRVWRTRRRCTACCLCCWRICRTTSCWTCSGRSLRRSSLTGSTSDSHRTREHTAAASPSPCRRKCELRRAAEGRGRR
jgi:hypothetical protein